MTLFDRLRSAIANTLHVSPTAITETTTEAELPAWDSLGHINLMMTLEQTFGVALEVEDFPMLTSVPAILQYLLEHDVV